MDNKVIYFHYVVVPQGYIGHEHTVYSTHIPRTVIHFIHTKEYKVLDGAIIVPGTLIVKPVFYSLCCYADEADLDPYFLNKYSLL